MKIYFDESGNFIQNGSVVDTFVCGLIIPEQFYAEISAGFEGFRKTLSNGSGEVKGSALDIVDRLNFCEWLGSLNGKVKIKCNYLQAEHNDHSRLSSYRRKTADDVARINAQYAGVLGVEHPKVAFLKKYEGLLRFDTRLPDLDFYHFGLYRDAIRDAFQFSIVYFMDRKYEQDFETYDFVFDRQLTRKLAPCEKLVKEYLLYLYDNAARTGNSTIIAVPDTWKNPPHIFERAFKDSNGDMRLDLIFGKGFQFEDSRNEIGLQLVDIVVNTVYQNITRRSDRSLNRCYDYIRHLFGGEGGHEILSIKLF